MRRKALLTLAIVVVLSATGEAFGQTTEFTYQGRLMTLGLPANGSHDFQFRLFDDLASETQVGPSITMNGVDVNNGVFSVRLDFGNQFPGANRFLEISVKASADQLFTTLTPRQAITSAPYAIKSIDADNATNASTAVNSSFATTAGNANQLNGIPGSSYVLTGDARLSNARTPLPNSPNYIQNTTSTQSGNFSISGSGTASSLRVLTNGGNLFMGNYACNSGYVGLGFGAVLPFCANYSLLGNGLHTIINRSSGGVISFREANSDQMTIAPGGNVGIGTLAPEQKLHVAGSEVLSTGAGSGFKFRNRESTSGTDDWVWYSSGNIARFYRANVGDLLTVRTNGNVGIGTLLPTRKLHVSGDALISGPLSAGSLTTRSIFPDTDGHLEIATGISVTPDGRVIVPSTTIGDTNITSLTLYQLGTGGSTSLCRNGALQISTCSSSVRYKSNISSFREGLRLISKLQPVSFTWKDGGLRDLGLVAEEVAQVEPLLITRNDKDEVEGVKYDRVGVVLVNAVKEQQSQIDAQQKTINAQQAQIKQQQEQLAALKKLVCRRNSHADVCKQR